MFTVTTCAPSAAISSEGLLSGLREKMPRRGVADASGSEREGREFRGGARSASVDAALVAQTSWWESRVLQTTGRWPLQEVGEVVGLMSRNLFSVAH